MNSIILRNELFSSQDSEDELPPKRRKLFKQYINFNYPSDREFVERFRMRPSEIDFVLSKIGPSIQHPTPKNKALSPRQQILIALHFLGNGGQYHGVSDMHGVSTATVCRSVHRVVDAIIENMFQETVRWPENSVKNASEFLDIGGFPSVCGLIDGTMINIDAPSENEEQFVNRKGTHAINALLVCGPHHQYYYVSARWPGSVHDSRVLKNTELYRKFESGWRPFTNAVILGNESQCLMFSQ